jgi:hypothetical protein
LSCAVGWPAESYICVLSSTNVCSRDHSTRTVLSLGRLGRLGVLPPYGNPTPSPHSKYSCLHLIKMDVEIADLLAGRERVSPIPRLHQVSVSLSRSSVTGTPQRLIYDRDSRLQNKTSRKLDMHAEDRCLDPDPGTMALKKANPLKKKKQTTPYWVPMGLIGGYTSGRETPMRKIL